jgi:hypothetical protein
MNIIKGNLWDYHLLGPVCITTNGIIKNNGELVMGAGIALQAKQRFPKLPRKLADAVSQYGNHAFYLPDENLFSLPTKNNWRDKSEIRLIARSCCELIEIINNNAYLNFPQVYLPKPGCANGQLSWPVVSAVIGSILGDKFTVVVQ